jgi:hypothetical protein
VAANVCPVEPVLGVLCVAGAAVDGSKAVPRDASCAWIWETRLTTSAYDT